jgi:hypothetical protein
MSRERQFKTRIKTWNFRKNIKSHEMEAIIKGEISWKADEGKESVFILGGVPVKKTKIDRYLKRKRKLDAVIDVRDHAGGKTLLCKF